ncbi:hypothetical protein G7Z17_g7878 [Cylindrodendrum hubeiense]|uniref:Uncharacterized protein n=1 Tax=Cylindrodendrum hubeiense TaxID=595255 RepID=A0A9P5H9P8_9HYPO|nr:hypothetical protein G7Z17_g7878 [Cylindrodendrum hubeiense]
MNARGTIWRQIRKVKMAMKKKQQDEGGEGVDDPIEELSPINGSQDGFTSKLPGLVWPKDDKDCYFINYRGWLFMYPGADVQWGTDSIDHEVCLVKFDPIPIEWDEDDIVTWDPMEHPIHSKRMNARGSEENQNQAAVSWMEDRKNANWEVAANDAIRLRVYAEP